MAHRSPRASPIFSVEEAEAAAKSLPGPLYVVKSQIHAGGRGKGKFKELGPDAKGGVRLAKSIDEVVAHAKEMLGNTLVTKQTGDAGKQVNRLYIEDGADIARELYLLAFGRPLGRPGGVRGFDRRRHGYRGCRRTIRLKRSSPSPIDPEAGVTDADVAAISKALELDGAAAEDAKALSRALQGVCRKGHGLLEVNPLIVMNDGTCGFSTPR